MLQPLFSLLDALGRFPHKNVYTKRPADLASQQWKAENLFKVWSPEPHSPWFPYAKATLFASADNQRLVSELNTLVSRPLQDRLRQSSELSWPGRDCAILADLSKDESAVFAAHFANRYGFQPVPLFNNWPHARGVVNCEVVLAGLLALAPEMAAIREKILPQSPPLFMVENSRLGERNPNEEDFDNRYFLSEEDLPPSRYLKENGIQRMYYVEPHLPGIKPYTQKDDLNPYFCALVKEGIQLYKVSVQMLDKPEEYEPKERKTVLSSFSLFQNSAFRRAAAGGFGALVPPRSSGG